MWSSTISTSATVLMISRCPGDQTRNDCKRYRSVQPVNRYVSCSCYPLSSVFVFLYQSPPGFLFLQVTNHIPLHLLQTLLQQIFLATPDRFPPCDSRSTLSGSAVSRSDMADRSRSCPAISLTASSVLPSGRSGLFSAIFLTISSARRSVSRRMASSACRCASTSAVTGSPFPAPADAVIRDIPTRGHR